MDLTEREFRLMQLAGEVTALFFEIDDFKEATKRIADKYPDYSDALWQAYFRVTGV